MSNQYFQPDLAAILGAAVSLYQTALKDADSQPPINLSDCYNGGDEFMRQVMRVAIKFERWSCTHVDFDKVDDVWPYFMENSFGGACLWSLGGPGNLSAFGADSCRRVAWKLRLPLREAEGLTLPLDVTAVNPLSSVGAGVFRAFRIQTVRNSLKGRVVEPFTAEEDPCDSAWGAVHFRLFGLEGDGSIEHLADRSTYVSAVALVRKLAPGVMFPERPSVRV